MNAGIYIKKVILFFSTDWEIWKVLSVAGSAVLSLFLSTLVPSIILVVLVLIDMRFGIKKYMKEKETAGEILKSRKPVRNVKSWGIRKTISKLSDYLFIITGVIVFEILLKHLDINIQYEKISISTLAILLLCIVELKSIDENIRELRGVSVITAILDFIFRRKSAKEILENEIEK